MPQVLQRAGIPDDNGPDGAAALAHALCWMTERNFYRAACSPENDFARATATTAETWRRVMNS
ncbi:hypothetical protein [Streptomyces coffeae]|uniref:hypothetical protein n=1 Tax=Streptomyces coffeae TaxID=621382 RepID=UPI001F2B2BB6|nr:hypothetical protein [Streptomyces coffeae]